MRSLTRRSVVAGGTAAAIALALQKIAIADAKAVYRDAIVIDGLGGLGNSSAPPGAPLTDEIVGDVRGSGITSVHMTILPVGSTPPDTAFTEAVLGIGKMESEIDRHADVLSRVRKVADVAEAKKTGRTGFIYGCQDAVAFETDLSRLDELYRLGLRIVQPTYNRRNLRGDGCLEAANAGLSKAGFDAVERMNDLSAFSWTSAIVAAGLPRTRSGIQRNRSPSRTRAARRRTTIHGTGQTRNCAPWRQRAAWLASASCRSSATESS